jgi:hypothetical protein
VCLQTFHLLAEVHLVAEANVVLVVEEVEADVAILTTSDEDLAIRRVLQRVDRTEMAGDARDLLLEYRVVDTCGELHWVVALLRNFTGALTTGQRDVIHRRMHCRIVDRATSLVDLRERREKREERREKREREKRTHVRENEEEEEEKERIEKNTGEANQKGSIHYSS